MTQVEWHLFPDIFLRKTGFPFDLLEELYCPKSVDAVKELLEIEREQSQVRDELQIWIRTATQALSSATRYFVSRMQKALTQRRSFAPAIPPDVPEVVVNLLQQWNQLAERWQTVYAWGAKTFQAELLLSRERLRQIVKNERFQEAVFLNSPNMYHEGLSRYLKGQGSPTKRRQSERTMMLYLQRFCAKNDTASFFGPLDYGRFQPDMAESIWYRTVGGSYPPYRRVLLTYWAAEALAETMQRDPRLLGENTPLRSALIIPKEHFVFVPSFGREVPLDPLSLAVLHSADGRTSLSVMSRMLDIPLDTLVERAQHLQTFELLQLRIPLPAHLIDPLEALEEIVSNFTPSPAKEEWEDVLHRFRHDLIAFEHVSLQERVRLLSQLENLFREVTKREPRRGQGQQYSDRLLVYEDTSGDIQDLAVGGDLHKDLASRLQASLDLFASCALVRYRVQQHNAWQQLQSFVSQTVDPSRLINLYLQARQLEGGVGQSETIWMEPWQQAWERLLGINDGRLASFRAESVAPALLEPITNQSLLAGPDVMLAARDREAILRGEYKIVLSEVHPALIPTLKALMLFHPNRERSLQQARFLLDHLTYPELEGLFWARRVSKIDSWAMGRPKIHPLWLQTSTDAIDVPLAEVMVDLSAPEAGTFRSPGIPRPYYAQAPFFVDEPWPLFLTVFTRPQVWAVPVSRRGHTPRIEVDGVVFQRERWVLGAAELPRIEPPFDTFEAFLAVWRWKQHWQMPEQLFLKPMIADVKPVLGDFLSPLSCLSLLHVMSGMATGVFTEMLPRPDELWMQQDGKRYTCELRFTAYRTEEAVDLTQPVPPSSQREPVIRTMRGGSQREPSFSLGGSDYSFDQAVLHELADHLRSVQREVQILITEY